jgi:hypothetical protein
MFESVVHSLPLGSHHLSLLHFGPNDRGHETQSAAFFLITMPPKKKKGDDEDLGMMRAARFGRVKNTLSMGFVGL